MKQPENIPFIPKQTTGNYIDLRHSVTCQLIADARSLYKNACRRLLLPYNWHTIAGNASAEFNVYEKVNSNQAVNINDHLFIDVPAGGLLPSGKHDWVVIENLKRQVIEHADESIGMILRPSTDQINPEDKLNHFFTDTATSTFIIERTGKVVTAAYHGRNEKPNIETGKTVANIRNAVVGLGAVIGLSKLQWAALIKGFLSCETSKLI